MKRIMTNKMKIKMMKMVLNMINNIFSFLLIADLKREFMKNLILVFKKFIVMQRYQFLKALFVKKVKKNQTIKHATTMQFTAYQILRKRLKSRIYISKSFTT